MPNSVLEHEPDVVMCSVQLQQSVLGLIAGDIL